MMMVMHLVLPPVMASIAPIALAALTSMNGRMHG